MNIVNQKLVDSVNAPVAILEKFGLRPVVANESFLQWAGGGAERISDFFAEYGVDVTVGFCSEGVDFKPVKFRVERRINNKKRAGEFVVSDFDDNYVFVEGKDITDVNKLKFTLESYSKVMEDQAKKLEKMAYTDALTGIANRRALFEKFGEELQSSGNHYSVSILDIDHFKNFNDLYGHDFGDRVLKMFTGWVSERIKGDHYYFARIGGEEFCIVGINRSAEELSQQIDSILDGLKHEDIPVDDSKKVNISFSAGTAEHGKDGDKLDPLLTKADQALYYAKAAGRSRVISFSTELFDRREGVISPKFREKR